DYYCCSYAARYLF
nr:immunoglobulin light chain junction region [Macaca mulatta]